MDERTAMMMAVVVVVVAAAAGGGCTRGERATARARERERHTYAVNGADGSSQLD